MENILVHSVRVADMVTVYTKGKVGDSVLLKLWNELSNAFTEIKFQKVYLHLHYDIEMIMNGIDWRLKKSYQSDALSKSFQSPSDLKLSKFKEDMRLFFKDMIGLEITFFGPTQSEIDNLRDILIFRDNDKGNVNDEPRKYVYYGQTPEVKDLEITQVASIKGPRWDSIYYKPQWNYLYVIYNRTSPDTKKLIDFSIDGDFFSSKAELGYVTAYKRTQINAPNYSKKLLSIPSTFEKIITQNQEFRKIIMKTQFYAKRETNILIIGDTGTGKEMFANAIKESGNRKGKPFMVINCANFSRDMLESHLFGHVKGAFTGAIYERKGILEEVDSGTLFLDEIGELDIIIQAKLLRVLQFGEFEKLGSNKTIKSDFRLISATNKKIKDSDNFRSDLYFRIAGFNIELPSLLDRGPEDIKILAEYFKKKIIESDNVEAILKGAYFADEAIELIGDFNWPGNVRQLSQFIAKVIEETLFNVTFGDKMPDRNGKLRIDESMVKELLEKEVSRKKIENDSQSPFWTKNIDDGFVRSGNFLGIDLKRLRHLDDILGEVEKAYLVSAIEKYRDQKEAAKMLGITQSKFSNRVKALGLKYQQIKKKKVESI